MYQMRPCHQSWQAPTLLLSIQPPPPELLTVSYSTLQPHSVLQSLTWSLQNPQPLEETPALSGASTPHSCLQLPPRTSSPTGPPSLLHLHRPSHNPSFPKFQCMFCMFILLLFIVLCKVKCLWLRHRSFWRNKVENHWCRRLMEQARESDLGSWEQYPNSR